jgi:hypothetical protein
LLRVVDPPTQQVRVDAVGHRDGRARHTGLLARLDKLGLELGAVLAPAAAAGRARYGSVHVSTEELSGVEPPMTLSSNQHDFAGRIRSNCSSRKVAQLAISVGLGVALFPVASFGFAVATGLRAANVKGLQWQYVDIALRHAWVPGSQHKNGAPHSVPLNEIALSVVRKQIGKHHAYVFTYQSKPIGQLNTKAWTAALQRERALRTSSGTICATRLRPGTDKPERRLMNSSGWAAGKRARWSSATRTSRRKPCKVRPADLMPSAGTLRLRPKKKDLATSPLSP